ncbi:hypothetical protein SteCoe_8979 [Stentor coeruleus]|uniref:C2H2-type domain-containing protein n=1 Tax=Stentor coeruleus TaxID=5963 RepID=A0A1R2CIY3_9CILI|nr:hypothetical protein SteCoe_8979 [Stentor coeruleus]
MKLVLEMMKREKHSELPDNLMEKLQKLSKICENLQQKSVIEGSLSSRNSKKILQLFYTLLKNVASIKYVLYGCYACNKAFKTRDYLKNHMIRRHQGLLVKSLSCSLNSHLTTWQTNLSSPSLDLADEINYLKEQQQEIKRQLESKAKDLDQESPRLGQSLNLNPLHNRSYKSLDTIDLQNFLREISSKPSSPPIEESYRNPQDLLIAAHLLNIDPVVDSHYLYIAKQFLDKPLPKNWKVLGSVFKNIQTEETVSEHPGIKHYKKLVKMMKHRKEMIIEKVKEVLKPCNRAQENVYKKGIQGYFWVPKEDFEKKKAELGQKLQDQILKLGKITMKMLGEIDKECLKRTNTNPGFNEAYKNIEKHLKVLMANRLTNI